MKTAKLIELERQRLAIVDEARSVLSELEACSDEKRTAELSRQHDALMRRFDHIVIDIDEERSRAAGVNNADRRPGSSGVCSGDVSDQSGDFARHWSGEARSGWVDQEGRAVRVLGPREQLSVERHEGVGLGDAVRAMITGARNDLERRALSEGTSSAGGYTVPAPLATWFIDRLRAQSVAIRAGAMTVPMASSTMAIARLETDPTIGWRAENAALAEGDPTFGRVLLTAKSLAGIVKISRELFADTVNGGAMIENALVKAMSLEMDRAAIYGDGSSNSPTGIINTSGINFVSMGTNGAQLASYDKLIDAVYEMQLDNAADPTGMIMHPRTGASLAKLKDSQSNPLTVPEMIAKIPRLLTTSAPIAETQGSASTASSIVFGDFSQLYIGLRESISIQMLDQLYAANGQVALAVHARMDVQLAHKESFSQLKGILP